MAEAGDRDLDTPERTERLQLVTYLVHNTEVVPFVRGPAGAGKTAFAERLSARLGEHGSVVIVDGTTGDVPAAVLAGLGLAADDWPGAVLDAAAQGVPVVLVDDAEELCQQAVADLRALHDGGGRVVLLGSAVPAGAWEGSPIQLVDLPPLTEPQARDLLMRAGITEVALWDDRRLRELHRRAGGRPGPLLADAAAGGPPPAAGAAAWKWALGGAAAGLVGLVLWQQERINALFNPPPPPVAEVRPVEQQPPTASDQRIAIPPLPAEPAPVAAQPLATDTLADGASATGDGPPAAEPVALPGEPVAQGEPEIVAAPADAPAPAPVDGPPPGAAADAGGVDMAATDRVPAVAPVGIPQTPQATPATPAAPETAAAEPPAPPAVPDQPVAAPTPSTAASPEAAPRPAPVAPATGDELAWLRSRPPGHFTLQLLGARDRPAIDAFLRAHGLTGKHAVFARDLDGKPWYSLVYGDYPDRDAALRGRAALPAALRGAGVWARSFASVQEQLPAPDPR